MKVLIDCLCHTRLLVVTLTVLACVGIWGCGDRVEFKWVGRGNMSIAGFIDDSLVVAYDCRGWLETTETWNGGYSEDEGCGHDRLLVYNYRVQEDGPRWSDSLTNKSGGYRWYQLTDSIFCRWEGYNILLWKLGETAHEMKLSRKNEGCSQEFEINRMRQWLGDSFIALGGRLSAGDDSCQYAVLDTLSRTLMYKRLNKDLEWIKECDDVRAWEGDIACLKKRNADFLNLMVNSKGLDSIFVNTVSFWDSLTISLAPLSFYGNMIYWAYVNSIDSEKWKIKLKPNIRPLSFPSFGEFIDEKKRVISY